MKRGLFDADFLLNDSTWDDWCKLALHERRYDAAYELEQIYKSLPNAALNDTSKCYQLQLVILGPQTFYLESADGTVVYMYAPKSVQGVIYYFTAEGNKRTWDQWTYRLQWPWTLPENTLTIFDLPPPLIFKIVQMTHNSIRIQRIPLCKAWVRLTGTHALFVNYWDKIIERARNRITSFKDWIALTPACSSLIFVQRMVSAVSLIKIPIQRDKISQTTIVCIMQVFLESLNGEPVTLHAFEFTAHVISFTFFIDASDALLRAHKRHRIKMSYTTLSNLRFEWGSGYPSTGFNEFKSFVHAPQFFTFRIRTILHHLRLGDDLKILQQEIQEYKRQTL